MKNLRYLQEDNVDTGKLRVSVTDQNTGVPVQDADIQISYTGDPSNTIEEVETDVSGNSEMLTLATPPLEYSMQPSERQPYAEYTITITAKGYRPISISGISVLPEETSLQSVRMEKMDAPGNPLPNIVIPANTLFGNFPSKIPESEVKSVTETGEIVLSRVVVPEFVVVHDGVPSDTTATNYYVRYRDYIKNVASSEIYSTWPDATIRANILAIMSFTLNRVYTEWYRNRQLFRIKK